MEEILHQLRLVVFPSSSKVLYISGEGLLPLTVVSAEEGQQVSTRRYVNMILHQAILGKMWCWLYAFPFVGNTEQNDHSFKLKILANLSWIQMPFQFTISGRCFQWVKKLSWKVLEGMMVPKDPEISKFRTSESTTVNFPRYHPTHKKTSQKWFQRIIQIWWGYMFMYAPEHWHILWKGTIWKGNFIFQPSFFRWYVSLLRGYTFILLLAYQAPHAFIIFHPALPAQRETGSNGNDVGHHCRLQTVFPWLKRFRHQKGIQQKWISRGSRSHLQ